MAYVSGFVTPVPEENREAYIQSAAEAWPLFREYGAVAHWECWEDHVPDGEVTSFPMAVKRGEGEKVVLSWVVWRDKEAYETCMATMDTDARWQALAAPFDSKRMIWGSFDAVFVRNA